MRSDRLREGGPIRFVTINASLAVGVHEVTFAELDACVASGKCGGHQPRKIGWGCGPQPVITEL